MGPGNADEDEATARPGDRCARENVIRRPAVVAAAGLVALAVAMGIGRFAFTPILPMMQVDAGLSVAEGGWLASANYLGYLLGALSAMVVRIRPTTAIRVGLGAIGTVTVAMAVTHRPGDGVALRAIAGVGSAWVLVFASAWCLDRLAPLRRPVLNSAVFAGVGVGIAVAGGFCLVLMARGAGSPYAWTGLGIVSLVATALVWPVFGGDGEAAAPPGRPPASPGAGRTADRVRLVLCYGAFGFGYIIPATFLPVMARQALRDPAIFGWAWPLFGAAAAASTLAAAGLSRCFGDRRLWSLCHLVMALGVVLPLVWPGIVGILWAALLVGGTFMVITMTGMQEARRVAGGRATGLMAALTSSFAAGQIVGPLCVSYLARADGSFREALVIACVALVASAGVLAWSPGLPAAPEPALPPPPGA
jgi:MFS family permease